MVEGRDAENDVFKDYMNKKEKEFKLFRSSFSSLDQEPPRQHRHLHHHHHIHTSPHPLPRQKAILINSSSGNSSLKSGSTSSLTSSSSSSTSSSRSSSQTAPLNQIKHKSNHFQNSFDYNNNNKPLSRHVRFNLDKSSLNRNSIEHLHKMTSKLRKVFSFKR